MRLMPMLPMLVPTGLVDTSHAPHAPHACPAVMPSNACLPVQVFTSPSLDRLISAQVQQAFLPKFENEGQDASIADAIVAGAADQYMVITIKHSGSLVTLSGTQGFAAKNSLNNEFTAGISFLFPTMQITLIPSDS